MGKKVKNPRVPRTRASLEWTEARFWQFIRSTLRAASRKWPPLIRTVFEQNRRPNQSSNKRMKWEFQCHECGYWFPRKEVEADHIIPCGSLKTYADLPGFVERLFCEVDGLRVLCKACHAERKNEK